MKCLFNKSLNGKVKLNSFKCNVSYVPNYTPNHSNHFNKPTVSYVTNITEFNNYTAALETTVHEDWICEFVNKSKNIIFFNISVTVKTFRKEYYVLSAKETKQSIAGLSL